MRDRSILVVAVVSAALSVSSVALAAFTSSPTATTTLATNTLAPPTDPAAANGPCTPLNKSVVVSWTPTTSTWADGYEILGSLLAVGPFTTIATVDGAATTSYTVNGLATATTYHYVVKATKANWRSAPTAVVSRTTLSALCA